MAKATAARVKMATHSDWKPFMRKGGAAEGRGALTTGLMGKGKKAAALGRSGAKPAKGELRRDCDGRPAKQVGRSTDN
jgi:hypothetical protein